MNDLLLKIAQSSVLLNDFGLTKEELATFSFLKDPASSTAIEETEKRLNVRLPYDYMEILKISNGFEAANSVEPSFLPVEKIDYLHQLMPDLIEAYDLDEMQDTADGLKRAILIAGIDEDQHFLLIPPKEKDGKYEYWKFANWIPGEEKYEDLEDYLKSILETNLEWIEELE